jgi:uroporphyrinogen decarboxylase
MTRREKFFRAIRREGGGYVPFHFSLCPSLHRCFRALTGHDDYAEYYGMALRGAAVEPRPRPDAFRGYFPGEDNLVVDEWGVGHRKGSLEHFTRMVHPMAGFTGLGEFQSYPYPDPVRDYRWEEFPARVAALKARDFAVMGGLATTVFEIAWYLRGMENVLVDLVPGFGLAEWHLDRITGIRCEMARRYAGAGVDVLHLGDDVATQRDMMIKPDLWRKFLKPRLGRVIAAAREARPDIIIDYHSDGNIRAIVPELVEIGVDVLNPVQPECLDPVELKERFGDRLSFRGTIGTQTTMPFGTPAEVKRVCRLMIETVGRGGGLVIAPTHLLEPEVPWANIEALVEAVREHNGE